MCVCVCVCVCEEQTLGEMKFFTDGMKSKINVWEEDAPRGEEDAPSGAERKS